MGCQGETAEKTVSREAGYILAVKGHQGTLEEDIERTVRFTKPDSDWQEDDFGHGRIESRHSFLYKDLSFIENAGQWKSLSAAVKIESARYIKSTGKEEKETRFYITSSMSPAETVGKAVRAHWGIENQLHRQLDVSFSEDLSRKRGGYATQNFSMIHRIALNLIKHEQASKRSFKRKRPDAGWNNEYLLEIPTD
jgi:predicted transposase YbfD/YdcC